MAKRNFLPPADNYRSVILYHYAGQYAAQLSIYQVRANNRFHSGRRKVLREKSQLEFTELSCTSWRR